nr:hypothetical protein [Tanacetum cinerariifolium]
MFLVLCACVDPGKQKEKEKMRIKTIVFGIQKMKLVELGIVESPVDTMADQRTMAELLRAPTEGYAEAIVVPSILAEHFELKHTILKQFQATPPPASVKAVEEICVTCSGAHPYYQCLAADGNTFLEFRDNIQGYVSAAANMMASFFQMNTASTSGSGPLPRNTIANPKGELKAITTRSGLVLDGPSVPMPPPFINPEEDERADETLTYPDLAEYTIKVPPPLVQKAKPPSQKNYVKLPEKLGDPEKFLISCGFSELKCKALDDLANRAICTPAGIARDVFVLVGKFTFLADFVIVDYESNPRVPLILGRPFLRTGHALIDIHGEEMILRDGDERLTLNMRHDTSSYLNQPQKELINLINIYNDSCEDYLKDLFATNHLSGNPTSSSHTDLTSPKVINPLSGSTTSSSPCHLLEEFVDELTLITFPSGNDDLPFDIESDLREIEYLLNHDPTKEMDSILKDSIDESNLADPNNNLVDTIPEMFTDEHTLDYSSPPLYDDFDDDLVELESDTDDAYNDPFDSKEDKIKESKLLINELDLLRSSDFLPSLEYDSFLFEDFSEVDALPSTDNEDKVFNQSILIHENFSEVTVQVTPKKNVKKISISNASLILEDFNPPLYELPFHKEVPWSETLLSFISKNKEKVFKPKILTFKEVHTYLLPKLSHQGEMKRGKAKVAWDLVCRPKLECGLGIKRLDDFNVALMDTHIWFTLTYKEYLWVKWIHAYKLNWYSLWDVPCLGDMSWGWRKVIQKRLNIRSDIVLSGFSPTNLVHDLINNGAWRWPLDWYTSLAFIHVPILQDEADDLVWRGLAGNFKKFLIVFAWDYIRLRADVVDWFNIIWSQVRLLSRLDVIPPRLEMAK